jgi:hypothetical protein
MMMMMMMMMMMIIIIIMHLGIWVVTRNTVAYPSRQSSSPSRGVPCSHKRGNDDRVTAENAQQKARMN